MVHRFAVILDKLLNQENNVLANWSEKKKRLDQCQQFVIFQKSADQALEWINEIGEHYLSTHTTIGATPVCVNRLEEWFRSLFPANASVP